MDILEPVLIQTGQIGNSEKKVLLSTSFNSTVKNTYKSKSHLIKNFLSNLISKTNSPIEIIKLFSTPAFLINKWNPVIRKYPIILPYKIQICVWNATLSVAGGALPVTQDPQRKARSSPRCAGVTRTKPIIKFYSAPLLLPSIMYTRFFQLFPDALFLSAIQSCYFHPSKF